MSLKIQSELYLLFYFLIFKKDKNRLYFHDDYFNLLIDDEYAWILKKVINVNNIKAPFIVI